MNEYTAPSLRNDGMIEAGQPFGLARRTRGEDGVALIRTAPGAIDATGTMTLALPRPVA